MFFVVLKDMAKWAMSQRILWVITGIGVLLIACRAVIVAYYGSPYMQHAWCIQGYPPLLWSMVVSHGVIALAYMIIPFVLFKYAVKGRDDQWPTLSTWAFVAFILLCGLGHIAAAITFFIPAYWLEAVIHMLTAGVSIITAFALPRWVKHVTDRPAYGVLENTIRELQAAKEEVQQVPAEDYPPDVQVVISSMLARLDNMSSTLEAEIAARLPA